MAELVTAFEGCGDVYVAKYNPDGVTKGGFVPLSYSQKFAVGAPTFASKEFRSKDCVDFGNLKAKSERYQGRSISFGTKAYKQKVLALGLLGDVVNLAAQTSGDNLLTPATITAYHDGYTDLPYKNLDTLNPPIVSDATGKVISGITLATGDPVAITATAHGLNTGDKVVFYNVGGTVELNGQVYTITKTSNDAFELDGTDGDDFTAWTTGGTVHKVYTELTDYEISYQNGMLLVLSTGAIADLQSLKVAMTYLGVTGTKVKGNTRSGIIAHVRFIGKNLQNNQPTQIDCYKVTLKQDGEIDYLGDDFLAINFTGDVISTDAGTIDETEYIFAT